ncbi:uncharacterized protein CANTADRAFT_171080 [Suhomyces tanzawaensis NRRL Y-17324]|uniref:Secreted protein n=1 Tax=Suhomyces tanzawaensis NRRL Y-17324 TaxID=984487 RepID=A0A1E4SMN6_9ASCO|nr:uncharacterized protein CANTADRAFT_171080 [Suhomyces tanzawaensis NRRL Y-17324]ODV80755.1 hypothetical protein CANTADRAFT_171080 [Suhomyces tanzawaensis NRRL Y-17324]
MRWRCWRWWMWFMARDARGNGYVMGRAVNRERKGTEGKWCSQLGTERAVNWDLIGGQNGLHGFGTHGLQEHATMDVLPRRPEDVWHKATIFAPNGREQSTQLATITVEQTAPIRHTSSALSLTEPTQLEYCSMGV